MTAEEMGLEPGTPEYAAWYAGTGVLSPLELANKARHQLNMANPYAVTQAGSSAAQGEAAAAAHAAAGIAEELERRRQVLPAWQASFASPPPIGSSADLSEATPWNPTPTNYNPGGQTDMERQLAAIEAAESERLSVVMSLTQQLEARRTGIPMRAIDELGGSAQFRTNEVVQQEEEPVSFIGGIVGGAAKFLTGGAKALLESRRDTSVAVTQYVQDPAAVPGMPSYSQASVVPWGAVGQTIGRIAGTLGTATTAYMAGQAILGGGNKGVIMGAVSPKKVNRSTLTCPPKYVLGVDGQCYPKSMLPRSARKWTPDPKPVVSRSDQKAITRAASAKKRLVKLTNQAGAHATISRPHKHTTSSRKK